MQIYKPYEVYLIVWEHWGKWQSKKMLYFITQQMQAQMTENYSDESLGTYTPFLFVCFWGFSKWYIWMQTAISTGIQYRQLSIVISI